MEIDSLHERALDDRTEEHKLANNQHIHQVKHWQSNQPLLKPITVITQAVSVNFWSLCLLAKCRNCHPHTMRRPQWSMCLLSMNYFQISVILLLICLCAGDGQSAAAVRGCLTSCSSAFGLGSAPSHHKPRWVHKHHQEDGQHCYPAECLPVSDKAAEIPQQWGQECEFLQLCM